MIGINFKDGFGLLTLSASNPFLMTLVRWCVCMSEDVGPEMRQRDTDNRQMATADSLHLFYDQWQDGDLSRCS